MTEAVGTVLKLKVAEALGKDLGRGLARLDPADMAKLEVEVGDTVEIVGKRPTVGKVMPAYKDLRGQSRMQIDGLTRENAGTSLDQMVEVRKVAARPATRVVLSAVGMAPSDRDLTYIGSLLDGLAVVQGDRIRATLFGTRSADFKVLSAVPAGPVMINPATALEVKRSDEKEKSRPISYEDIGGLKREIQRIREIIELPLRYPEVFERLGIDAPKGVLLHGPPGCGKTLIARAVAHETEANFFSINGPEIIHKFYGESEANLRKIFEEAARKAPSIIFLDEIDAIAPRREKVVGDVEKRVVAQLLALMDGLVERGEVVVIGATNMPDLVDVALRRPGRFDREITIGIPDPAGRRAILGIHSRRMPLGPDVDLDQLAEMTHGYVGADLAVLCKEAGMVALRRLIPQVRFEVDLKPQLDALAVQVTRDDFMAAFKVVEPTATREFLAERPRITFKDVGGLTEIKRTLSSIIQLVRGGGALLGHTRFNPPKGILLTGTSGTGKTLLARALAGELGLTLITVDQPRLLSKWVGESEKGLREVFKRAKQASPCILFFDEIESLVPARSVQEAGSVFPRLVSQLFRELDDLHGSLGVVVLAATNRPDLMEPALLRAGRFDYVLELPLPNRDERREILEMHTEGLPLEEDVDLGDIAEATGGWTGADLELICKKAAILALEEFRGRPSGSFRVALRHLREAEAQVKTMK